MSGSKIFPSQLKLDLEKKKIFRLAIIVSDNPLSMGILYTKGLCTVKRAREGRGREAFLRGAFADNGSINSGVKCLRH